MIPLATPDLRGREAEYLVQCVRDNWVSSAGPFVTRLEQEIARLAGAPHGVATMNGTAAIHLALLGAGVKPGGLVIVPDWTFAATANAVAHAGARPWFVDVTAESWSLDPVLVDEALAADGRVAAVIAVDALGHPADMDALRRACAQRGVPLIEDAAAAVGARYKGRPCGGLGDFGTFSFNGNTTITAGGGGMIVTSDEAAAKRMRSLSAQARSGGEYLHDEVGWNYRMTNLNAAVALAQLERLDEMLAIKRKIARRYDGALGGRNDLIPMPRQAWADSGCWHYGVLAASKEDAGALVAHMAAQAIEARVFWRSLSEQKPWTDAARTLRGMSHTLSGRVVVLPCSTHIRDEDLDRVVEALASFRGSAAVDRRPLATGAV
jgi:dTDP-4-amino-4,6-dideoxygalactose transaminase